MAPAPTFPGTAHADGRVSWPTVMPDLLVVAAIVATGAVIVGVVERARRDGRRQHRERLIAALLTSIAPVAARADPRELCGWRPVAVTARALFPDIVAAIESRTGERFPFPRETVEEAHARWTAEWLAWERRHDADFRQRASALEAELDAAGEAGSPAGRARMAALDDEKLQAYQHRYEEYVRIGNGLAALRQDEPETADPARV